MGQVSKRWPGESGYSDLRSTLVLTRRFRQICVAPDYVLIPREKQDEFVAELKKHHDDFFPEGTLRSKSFGRIVSAAHHERLVRVLNGTQGKIVLGGHSDELKGFEATIVRDVQGNDSLMEE